MPDQVTNMSAVAEQSQLRPLEMTSPASASSSQKLLGRIAILLFIISRRLADGVRVLRELDLHHSRPGGISCGPV